MCIRDRAGVETGKELWQSAVPRHGEQIPCGRGDAGVQRGKITAKGNAGAKQYQGKAQNAGGLHTVGIGRGGLGQRRQVFGGDQANQHPLEKPVDGKYDKGARKSARGRLICG